MDEGKKKYRVKVNYCVDLEAKGADGAIREASYAIPDESLNVHIECWPLKEKPVITNSLTGLTAAAQGAETAAGRSEESQAKDKVALY